MSKKERYLKIEGDPYVNIPPGVELRMNGDAGSNGQVLASGGTGANPSWVDPLTAADVWSYSTRSLTYKHQAIATLKKDNAVGGTWYTVLGTTNNVIVYYLLENHFMNAITPTVRLTIDGETIEGDMPTDTATEYYAYLADYMDSSGNITQVLQYSTTRYLAALYSALYANSLKVEIKPSGNCGLLCGGVIYGKA